MLSDLTPIQQQLMNIMSGISERCYTAGWMNNLEYVLWNAVMSGPRKYGYDFIREEDIHELRHYSTLCNSWIVFDEGKEETSMQLNEWKRKFENDTLSDKSLLMG
ncbi:MAG: hypothetical protein J7604_22840 [Sporocytophaga sp.]|uniref:hypothetical protein n=1 Tax=Sporocytophaga sp. TaxID=2231183 RepID=UPI001B1CBEAD|nr:hypothetical protein [Sporocytophaga sp.]MBO9703068.1 hypothetical protein [Sporocytophaga sp.]